MNSTTIIHLPPEIVCHILRHLSLSELIEKKLTCKLWNELISSQVKVTRLIVPGYFMEPQSIYFFRGKKEMWKPSRWSANRPVDEYLEVCDPHLFVAQLNRPILTNLRHLRVSTVNAFDELDDFNFNDLNVFTKLEYLEADYSISESSASFTRIEWHLPNLEILKFNLCGNEREGVLEMWIDCPKLKVLFYDRNERECLDVTRSINIKWPETITTLGINFYDSELSTFKSRPEFKVENDAMIPQLPNLKVLKMNKDPFVFFYQLGGFDAARQLLKRLLSDRKKARFDLRLFFAGIEIIDETQVDHLNLQMAGNLEGTCPSREHLYFCHSGGCKPKLQEELEFIEDANYTRLMSLMDEIPANYFTQFWNIRIVVTNGDIPNPDHFTFYLQRLEYLGDLELYYPSLKQDWYDSLPTICRLKNFILREKDEIKLNFDFLGFFEPHIRWVDVYRKLSLTSARPLANLIKAFRWWYNRKFCFKFRGKDAMVRIRKSNEDSDQSDTSYVTEVDLGDNYDLLVNKKLKLERVNSMEIVNYFEGLEELELW